jgi:hypothetical protein
MSAPIAWRPSANASTSVVPPPTFAPDLCIEKAQPDQCPARVANVLNYANQFSLRVKLPRFRGHRTICVRGVHNGQDKRSLPT